MPGVPALYEALYSRRVFTTDEAVRVTGQPKEQVVKQISYLQAQGYLDKVRRGLYAIVPLEARPEPAPANPYLVASKLTSPYVLSYHTGLELHGVAQSAFYRVFVATPKPFTSFEYQGVAYEAVKASPLEVEAAATPMTVEDQSVVVASREWTVAHCALRLQLAAGLEELLKSAWGFAYLDPAKLLETARVLGYKVLHNRLGFLLTYLGGRWDVTEADLEPFRAGMSKDVDYFGSKPGHAKYVSEWRVMVPDNLEQVIRPA